MWLLYVYMYMYMYMLYMCREMTDAFLSPSFNSYFALSDVGDSKHSQPSEPFRLLNDRRTTEAFRATAMSHGLWLTSGIACGCLSCGRGEAA